jgi:hypothetical protein
MLKRTAGRPVLSAGPYWRAAVLRDAAVASGVGQYASNQAGVISSSVRV